jgi:hypothetical protein
VPRSLPKKKQQNQPQAKAISAAAAGPKIRKASGGIPVLPPVRGLTFDQKGKDKDNIQKRLQKKSPWYQSIIDPLHGADCKIPDETGVETGTLQDVTTGLITANTAGVCGIRVMSPYPNLSGPGPSAYNYEILAAGANAANMVYDPPQALSSQAALAAYAKGVRVVSACVSLTPEAALANNAGELLGFTEPFTDYAPLTYDEYANNYKTTLAPINNNRPVCSRWYPCAVQHMDFKQFYHPSNPVGDGSDESPFWTFGVVASGPIPSLVGAVFRWRIVVNYEFIPQENAINILDARPSPSDAQETDLVENWVQGMQPSTMATTKSVSSPPSSVEPAHEDDETGFGMAFNVLSELLPFAMALL